MKTKLIAIIFIILIAGILIYSINSNQINVGSNVVTLPDGFSGEKINDMRVNISNENSTFIISEYNSSDIKQGVNNYVKEQERKGIECNISKFYIDDITVYKSNLTNNTNILHYWFLKENKIYEITTKNGDSNTDVIIYNLIKSMNS